ncbi:MAG TPA: DUF1345 domain-containing protein [Chthoniobacteraceae bacterium]|jgi:uncharacterized membrane protein|nr:DUF1345 domain-containing protein [Chthoniobacteraceae bacterium]
MSSQPQPAVREFILFDSRFRTMAAVAAGMCVYFLMRMHTSAGSSLIAAWDGFALVLLALVWAGMCAADISHMRARAREQDVSRFVVFIFTITAACLSIFAVVALLSAAKQSSHVGLHAALSVVAVASSWTLVHTVFALRYAHAYYDEGETPEKPAAGLEFPNDDAPNYFDFAYFSFVIGMTCQVSDVQISAKGLRGTALIHGTLSFCFNTVILALTINTISGLL